MKNIKIKEFKIIGISVRTTNKNNQAVNDIAQLWGKFMTEDIASKIPNKISEEIYSIYTDYEGDFMQPYTTIIGCKVESFDTIPEGMITKTVETSNYYQTSAHGNIMEGAVGKKWGEIWQMDINRSYCSDFEVYGEKASNPNDAEVEIFISTELPTS
jgi:predicted transcriptional regulator YdeE